MMGTDDEGLLWMGVGRRVVVGEDEKGRGRGRETGAGRERKVRAKKRLVVLYDLTRKIQTRRKRASEQTSKQQESHPLVSRPENPCAGQTWRLHPVLQTGPERGRIEKTSNCNSLFPSASLE